MAKKGTDKKDEEGSSRAGASRTRLISPIANTGAKPFSKEQQLGKKPGSNKGDK